MELKSKIYFCPKCRRRVGIPKFFLNENVKNLSAGKVKITCGQPLAKGKKCDGYVYLKHENTKSGIAAAQVVEQQGAEKDQEVIISEQTVDPNIKEHENIS